MGRKLDYAVLWALLCGGMLAYFLSAVKNFPLAAALTCICIFCAGKIVRSLSCGNYSPTRRARREEAKKTLNAWRYLPEEEGSREVEALILRARKLEKPTWSCLYLLRRHSGGRPFDMNDFLQIWPSIYREENVLLVATGPVDEEVCEYLSTLEKPVIELVREKTLLQMLEREVTEISPHPHVDRTIRAKRALRAMLERVRPARCIWMGGIMLGMYFLLRVWSYLPASIFLFLLCAAHWIARFRRAL